MTITLYLMELSPPCRTVNVLLNVLDLKVNRKFLDWEKKDHEKEDYLKINPFHAVPAIDDDGYRLFESRAIMTYLMNKYAPDNSLYPKDPQQRGLVDAMLNYDVGTFNALLTRRLVSMWGEGKDCDESTLKTGQDHLKCLNNLLATRKFSAGDHLTIADISLSVSLSYFYILKDNFNSYPNIVDYKKRVMAELGSHAQALEDKDVKQTIECIKQFNEHTK